MALGDRAGEVRAELERVSRGKTGRIAHWVETIYEPEIHAFGGTTAMDIAHRLFTKTAATSRFT
ncbi:hypothetical protein Aglo03_06950 [Actinokineospora globicatena]|uniref:Thiopeptide-type bacteriocin biosynthesis domain-containing protein n=1 Tax=Actinokineospora globicatena TaxID=103729 RepID=A0A9W6QJR9_9PSEU|nr:hypothetical protein Aglo03_06950 [Actinokineospora globicatena]